MTVSTMIAALFNFLLKFKFFIAYKPAGFYAEISVCEIDILQGIVGFLFFCRLTSARFNVSFRDLSVM